MNQIAIAACTSCLYLMLSGSALAQPRLPFAPTDQEMLRLPEECQAIRKGGPAADTYAKRLQAQGITGISHYCAGLNFMNRAKSASLNKIERRFNLQSSIGEFDYVLGHSASNATGRQAIQALKEQAEMMLKHL